MAEQWIKQLGDGIIEKDFGFIGWPNDIGGLNGAIKPFPGELGDGGSAGIDEKPGI